MEDGRIPGESHGDPGHPGGTHEDGRDIDIAYYQIDTRDNAARPVCKHTERTRSGAERCRNHNECAMGYCWQGECEAYHCTDEPELLDPWRTAMFLGALHESGNIRVVGVDGRIGPLVQEHLDVLCDEGWLSRGACGRLSMTWEEEDEGRGWYLFHHHHMHISCSPPRYRKPGAAAASESRCLVPDCDVAALDAWLRGKGVVRTPPVQPPR